MSIRARLLLLFLVLSLVPVGALGLLAMWSTRELGLEIAERNHLALVERERAYLDEKVAGSARRLGEDVLQIERALAEQVRAAEEALASADPSRAPSTASDFTGGSPATRESARYARQVSSGNPEPLAVSFQEEVTQFAPGSRTDAARRDARRLGRMDRAYRNLHESVAATALWHHTTLISGAFNYFPGQDAVPVELDPRDLPWFNAALESGIPVRSEVRAEPLTGELVVTFAQAVLRSD